MKHCTTSLLVKKSHFHRSMVTPYRTPSAFVKATLVNGLSMILAWKPSLAACLGKLIWRLLPWLREA
jgi:hypothetical protein